MKNRLMLGASMAALVLTLNQRAAAQTGACGNVTTTTTPNTVSCVSDAQNYPGGISYNQNTAATPAGLVVNVLGTAVVQPNANTTGVQVTGRSGYLAGVDVYANAKINASGTGYGVYATTSGGGNAVVTNGGRITSANADAVQILGGAGIFINAATAQNALNQTTSTPGSVSSTILSGVTGDANAVITNVRGGTITGGSSAQYGYGVQFAGNSGTLNNYGNISGGTGGVLLNANIAAGNGATLNLYAGSTTGAILESVANSPVTVNLYTGTTTTTDNTMVDPLTGLTTTLRPAGTYAASSVGAIALGGAGTIGLNGAGTGAQAGTLDTTNIAGVSQIVKADTGTWALTGNNTGGIATIKAGTGGGAGSAGTLVIGAGNLNATIYVNGATLRSISNTGFGMSTIDAITPTIQFGTTATAASNIFLQSADTTNNSVALQADNGVTVTLNGAITQGSGANINGATIAANQPLTFGLTTGSPAGSTATFILGNTANNWTGVTNVSSGVTLQGTTQTISGSRAAVDGTLAFNQTQAGASALAISGNGAVTIGGAGAVTLTGAITTAGGVTIGSGATATLSSVSNAAGAAAVTLSGNNSTLSVAGRIASGSSSAVRVSGTGNAVTIQTAGTVNGGIDASTTTGTNSYSILGTLTGGLTAGSGADAITVSTGAMVSGTLDGGAGADTLTLNGTGSGAIGSAQIVNIETATKSDAGTWTLSGTTAASPSVWNVQAGTLSVTGGDAIADTAAVTVGTGATLNLGANEAIGSLAGTGNVTLGANVLTSGGNNSGTTFGGVLSGTGGLTKTGTGTFILSGANTYTGATKVNGGTLALGASDRLADASAVTVASGAILDLGANSDTVASLALNGTLNGTGTLTAATYGLNAATVNANLGAGTLTQTGGVSVLNGTSGAGTVNVTGGTLQLGVSDRLADAAAVTVASGAVLDLQGFSDTVGTAVIGGTLNGTGTLTAATYGLNAATVNANLGAGTLTQTAGLSVLNGTAAAATVNVTGGTLRLGAANRLADAAVVTVSTGAVLDLQGFSDTVGTSAIGGTLNGTGTLTAATYGLNAATVNANLGAGTLTQTAGLSVLNGTAAAATVNVTGGTLRLGAANRLADAAAVSVASGAVLDLQGFSDTVGTAVIGGTLNGTGTLTAATYALNAATVNANLGAGTLTQTGGVSVLNGAAGAGTVNVNAGTLRLGASDRLADAAAVTVSNGAVLDLQGFSDTVATLALNGTLNGTGTLTAATYALNTATVNANLGAGTLTQAGGVSVLNGTSGAGTVNVTGGTLQLGASDRLADAAAVTVASGAILDLQGFSDTVGTAVIGGTLNGTGTLTAATYGLNAATVNANLGAGTLTQTGGVSVLNGTAGVGTVNVNAGTLRLGASDRLADAAAVTVASGAILDLQGFSDTVASLALNGTLNGTGTLTAAIYGLNAATVNANLGAGTLTQTGGVSVLNGTSGAGTVNVTGGTLQLGASDRLADAAAVTVASGAILDLQGFSDTVGTVVIGGTLNGTGTLTAATYGLNAATVNANLGAGTLTQTGGVSVLNGTSGAGTVNVTGGTLQLGASDRLADAAAVTVASGAILDLQGFSDTVASLALNGTLNGTGTLTAATYGLNAATVNANLGAGTLTQTGGVSVLNGTSGAGTVNVAGGTLQLGASDRLADAAAVTVSNGAVLDLQGFSDTVASLALNGTLNGTGTLTAATYGLNAATVNANLGAGTLTQTAGLSVLNGTAGAATVNVTGGTLRLGAANRLADAAVVTVSTGAVLDLQGFSDTVGTSAIGGTLNGTGTLTAATYGLNAATVNANLGTGTLTQTAGLSVLNGTAGAATVNVTGGTLRLGAANRLADAAAVSVASGAVLDLQGFSDTVGTAVIGGTLNGTGTLTAATYALNAATVNANLGAGTLTQTGGVSVLNGAAGAGTVNVNAGTLRLGASDRLADAAAVTVSNGAVLDLQGFSDTVATLALNGTLNGTATLTAATYALNTATVNANLGAGTLTQAGGVSVLNGTSGAGTVNVTGGTLRLGTSERVADNAALTVANGATFDLAGNSETLGSLAGAGTVTLGTGTLLVGGANANTVFTGIVTGSGGLTKIGSGTQTIVGAQPLTGPITINAGTLALSGSTAGAVRVAGGTFAGTSTVAGALTISSGTISPGTATSPVGQIQAATLAASGGTLAIDFGGSASGFSADTLKIVGNAAVTGLSVSTAAVDASATYRPTQTYQVLQAGTLTGSFANGSAFAQVSSANPDLYWRLRTDLTPNAVLLEVRRVIDFGANLGSAATPNQAAVGTSLSTGTLGASDSYATFLNSISAQTSAQQQATFDSIGGESTADISTSAAALSNSFVGLLRRRMASGGDGNQSLVADLVGGSRGLAQARQVGDIDATTLGFADGAGGSRGGAWVEGFGGAGRLDGANGMAELHDHSYGVAAGIDGRFGAVTAGAAFSVASLDADIAARASTNKGTLYQGGGYVAYDNGVAYGSLIGSYFSGNVDSARQVSVGGAAQGTAVGRAHVDGVAGGVSAGYRMTIAANGTRFTPQASLQVIDVSRGAFNESGVGQLSLAVGRQHRTLYTGTLEGRFSRLMAAGDWTIEPYVGGGGEVQFGDRAAISTNQLSGAPISASAFTIRGAMLSPVVGLLTAGIEARPTPRVAIGLGAEGRASSRQFDGRVQLHLRLGF